MESFYWHLATLIVFVIVVSHYLYSVFVSWPYTKTEIIDDEYSAYCRDMDYMLSIDDIRQYRNELFVGNHSRFRNVYSDRLIRRNYKAKYFDFLMEHPEMAAGLSLKYNKSTERIMDDIELKVMEGIKNKDYDKCNQS